MHSTTPEGSLAPEITLTVGEQPRLFELLGVARWGAIYANADERESVVRVLGPAESTLDIRHSVRSAVGRVSPTAARITSAWQDALDEAGSVYVVQYEVPPGASPVGQNGHAAYGDRLRYYARVCEELEGWWSTFGAPLQPLPADLWRKADGDPLLLPFPCSEAVGLTGLRQMPCRLSGVAPEYFQPPPGNREAWARELDLFAVASLVVAEWPSLPPEVPFEYALQRAACGLEWIPTADSSPQWTERLGLPKEVREGLSPWLTRSLAPGSSRIELTPRVAAARLHASAQLADPAKYLRSLRRKGPLLDAYKHALEVLRDEQGSDLLTQAGRMAAAIHRPLEAVDYLGRAAREAPDRSEPHEALFDLLCAPSLAGNLLVAEIYESRIDLATELDRILERTFDWLDQHQPHQRAQREIQLARHYSWRGETSSLFHDHAARFIRPRLFRQGNQLRPEKFELCAEFAAALLNLGRASDAAVQLDITKSLVQRMKGRNDIDRSALRRTSQRIAELEKQLEEQRS